MLHGARQMLVLALRQRAVVEVITQQMKVSLIEAIAEKAPVLGGAAIIKVASNKLAIDLLFKSLLTSGLAISKQMPSALLKGSVEALQSPEFKEYLIEMVVMNSVNFALSKVADINTAGANLSDIKSPTFSIVNKIGQVFADALFSKGLDSANDAINDKLSEFLKTYPDAPTPLISDQDIKSLSALSPDEIEKKINDMISQKIGNIAEVGPADPIPQVAPVQTGEALTPLAVQEMPRVEQALPGVAPAAIPTAIPRTSEPVAGPPGILQPLLSATKEMTSKESQILRRSLTPSFQDAREPKRGLAGVLDDEPESKPPKPNRGKDHGKK